MVVVIVVIVRLDDYQYDLPLHRSSDILVLVVVVEVGTKMNI
jgi:hypothetical protein